MYSFCNNEYQIYMGPDIFSVGCLMLWDKYLLMRRQLSYIMERVVIVSFNWAELSWSRVVNHESS